MTENQLDYSDKNLFSYSLTIEANKKKYNIDMLLCFCLFECEATADGKDIEELAQMFEEFMEIVNNGY